MKTTYTTELCGDKFEITADFSQASCPISGVIAAGRWLISGTLRPKRCGRSSNTTWR